MLGTIILSMISISCDDEKRMQMKFAYITKTLANDYHRLVAKGTKEEANRLNVHLEVFAPESEDDYQYQQQIIDTLKNNKFDALLLAPNHSSLLLPNLARLTIPFIVVDTPLSENSEAGLTNNCGYVGTDNLLGGKLAAQYISSKLKEGNIVLIRGVHTHRTSLDREKGFLDELEKHSGFNIIAHLDGQWLGNIAITEYKKFLKRSNKPVGAVFAYNDLMAKSVADFYKGRTDRPIIIGFNGSVEAQKAILDNAMDASVIQTPETMGKQALKKIVECVNFGRANNKRIYLTPVALIRATRSLTTISTLE